MNNSTARINPYIIGRPTHEPEKFFGRESLFRFIEDNLKQDIQFILLHGQRRIGMSSILQQIPDKVAQDNFVFVLFDLQGYSESSLSEILYELAEEIISQLELDSDIVIPPSEQDLNNNSHIFYDEFIMKVFQELDDKNLVLLLDEFGVANSFENQIENHIENQGAGFFKYLKSLLKKQNRLFIIPVLGRALDDLHNLRQLFKDAPFQEVGLLDRTSTKRLIINPGKDVLKYEEDAIQAIWELSSGHPYFTQTICFNLFVQAEIEKEWTVTREHVSNIVDRTIESAAGGLAWFWDGLSISEQVVFSAVAKAQKIALEQKQSFPEHPLTLLKKFGVIHTEEIIQAVKTLTENKFLDDTERRVRIELVRRWLVQERPVTKTILQLEKFGEKEIKRLSEEAKELHQQGQNKDAIYHYEQILEINHNHFSTLPILAEIYLETENFNQALELYERAYKVEPVCSREVFLAAQEKYGEHLIKQREYTKAKSQFEKVLEIDPQRESAKYKLQEIEAEFNQQQQLEIASKQATVNPNLRGIILGSIAAGIIAFVGGIGVYQFLTPCPGGQQKVNGIFCSPDTSDISLDPSDISNNISRGDRTFFPTTRNPSRDQGIEAFKKGNYSQAVKLFQKSVKDNRNDPEVLIYHNNAKAREKGNPLTIAAVLSTDNAKDVAQGVLRGVAQAQNQFNDNNDLGDRLLEIVIANDSNEKYKAKQIAKELLKDKSILGVIGHNTSDATKAAFEVYEKSNISVISPTSASNELKGKFFFRTVPSNAASSEKLAEYTINSKFNKVAVFYNPNSVYSKSLKEKFAKNFKEEFQGQIIREIDLTDAKLNIEQELKNIASQQVQAIMLFPNLELTPIAREIAKVNARNTLGLKLITGSALYNKETVNDVNFEGLVLTIPWFSKELKAKYFFKEGEKQWGGAVNWFTATSYDATQAILKAIASSPNPSRENVLQELPTIELEAKETSGYRLQFEDGERKSSPILVEVKNGQFKLLKTP